MLSDRDRHRLVGCHLELVAKVDRIFGLMQDKHGLVMMVTDGARTASQQHDRWLEGREIPGPDVTPDRPLGRTVTDLDGVTVKSYHQSGRAVDCCFVVHGEPSWDPKLPWDTYGTYAEQEGLYWGGRWHKRDMPHIQLPPLPAGAQVA